MKEKQKIFPASIITLVMAVSCLVILSATTVTAADPPPLTVGGVYSAGMNPFIPLWDYNPDTDPHVFHDPDNPGKYRLYLFNSHDLRTTAYCGTNEVLWSAPVEDLTQWTYHGVIVDQSIHQGTNNDIFFAPTACEVDNGDGTYTYYYIPFSQGGGRASMMLKADRPDGPYTVINWNGASRTQTTGASWNFDPALFVDDDGRMYGFWGGYSSAITGAELDPAAPYNIKPGTSSVQVAPLYSQTNGSALSVFEAVALSKMTIDGHTKYVMTYARRGLSGEPWGTTSAMKAYATSDNPLGPYEYGGPLVYAGGEIVNGSSTYYTHNTHGNLVEINGQWYISYHRGTNNHGYSRQAMVEPVYPYWDDVSNKLVIPMAEVTSQGFQINGLDPYKTLSAGYACYTTPISNGPYVASVPANRLNQVVTNNNVVRLVNNSLVGYKYFNFTPRYGMTTYFTADFTPSGVNGTIEAFIGNPVTQPDVAQSLGTISIDSTMPQVSTKFKIAAPILDDPANAGKHALFLRFTSSSGSLGSLDYIGFNQEINPESLRLDAKMNEKDGVLTVVADVYSGKSDLEAFAIAAVYDKAGRLFDLSVKNVVLPAWENEVVVSLCDVKELKGEYSVKVFLWDMTMVPLVEAAVPVVERDPLVSRSPETFCNPINISYRFQVDESTGWYRAMADMQPVYYRGEYWLFPTCASGYFYSSDLINWEFVYSDAPQIDTYAPGAFVLNDYLYVGRFNGNIYRSNNPKNGASWQAVRASNTNYADPYFYLDPDTGRLFVLHGCNGLTNNNANTTPAVRILELDTTSPTLAALPVDTSVSGATSAGYPVLYMRRDLRGYEVPGQLNDNYAATAQSWLEGAGMIKHDGKYYLYYTGPGSEYAGYCDACYVADDPLGPYTWCDNSPFAYKATGFTVGTGHGHHVEEQISGRIWKFGTINISNRHIFERRTSLYPVDFNSDGQPITDLSYADYPMYVPTNPKGTFENQGPGWNLVSYGAKVTVSSTYDVDVTPVGATKMAPFHISPEKAFDESIRTWWSAETGNAGEWIMGDMGKVCMVNAVQLNFADQDAARLSTSQPAARAYDGCYRYVLEYSVDGENWITIADRSDYVAEPYKAQDYSHEYFELLGAVPMRYVRVTNEGPVPANGKFAISDIRLFGDGGNAAPGKVENFSLNRVDGRDERTVLVSWDPVPDAMGYMIRFGTHEDNLNIHHQVLGRTSEQINILTLNEDYYFRIDTFNDSGKTIGTKIVKIEGQK